MFKKEDLVTIANMAMPFGKYKGKVLIDLPEDYLLWFDKKGFPTGKLGMLMQLTLEIKCNGQDDIIVYNPEAHGPLGKPVKFSLWSKDVLHNFTVAQGRVKRDRVPGMNTCRWLTPTRTGRCEWRWRE